ncbi:MAG TPA: DMT family transporter [Roseiarcus sp.]|nr:DMT family transporter [Roseiarcus sp.]
MESDGAARRRGLILTSLATLIWSTAGVFARLLGDLDVWTVLGGRAGFGALFMSVVAIIEWRRGRLGPRFGLGSPLSPLIVLLAALAMTTYIAAIRVTTVAEVMVIYSTLPFVAAGLAFALLGERPSMRTLAAACLALIGVVVTVSGAASGGQLLGQGLSFVMTVSFALLVVLQRRRPEMSMTAITTLGSLASALFALALSPRQPVGAADLVIVAIFGLATVCVAFVMFMEGAKHIPAAESALINMAEAVLGPLWVFLAFGENPGVRAMIGGALVLGAVLWRIAPDLWRAGAGRASTDVGAPPLL